MAAMLTNDFSFNAASVGEDSPETAAAEINDDEMDGRAEELVPERVQQMVLPAFTLHASHHIQMDVLFSTRLQHNVGKRNRRSPMMNSARIHDKCTLKKFWEQKIEKHVERTGNEDSRMKTSALSKLREEWIQRLQIRNQLLIESMREEQLRKAKRVQAILRA